MDASKRLVNLFYAGATILSWMIFSKTYSLIFSVVGARDVPLLGKEFTFSTLLAALTAFGLFLWAWRHHEYRKFSYEVSEELVKVSWPDWDETKGHTKVTIWVTIIISLILWIFDQVFGNLTDLLLGF